MEGRAVLGVAVVGVAEGVGVGAKVGYRVSVGDRGFLVGSWVGAAVLKYTYPPSSPATPLTPRELYWWLSYMLRLCDCLIPPAGERRVASTVKDRPPFTDFSSTPVAEQT